jgi:hypothetical protein
MSTGNINNAEPTMAQEGDSIVMNSMPIRPAMPDHLQHAPQIGG